MLIFGRNQIRDQQIGQCGLPIVVAKRQCSCRGLIQKSLQLEAKITGARCKDWILTIALSREHEV